MWLFLTVWFSPSRTQTDRVSRSPYAHRVEANEMFVDFGRRTRWSPQMLWNTVTLKYRMFSSLMSNLIGGRDSVTKTSGSLPRKQHHKFKVSHLNTLGYVCVLFFCHAFKRACYFPWPHYNVADVPNQCCIAYNRSYFIKDSSSTFEIQGDILQSHLFSNIKRDT